MVTLLLFIAGVQVPPVSVLFMGQRKRYTAIKEKRRKGAVFMAEIILWIFFLAGWLATVFTAGCLLEELSKRLRAVPRRQEPRRKKLS